MPSTSQETSAHWSDSRCSKPRRLAARGDSASRLLGYARFMQWLLLILVAIVVLAVLSFVISALKWLLVLAAILVVLGLLTGVLPGRGSGIR